MNRKITKIIAIIAAVAMLASFFAISAAADETTIAASGYAAIGVVDAGANKAEVLLGTGEQGTVFYNGDAPTTGGVYRYTRDENNLYTFVAPEANFGGSSLTDASLAAWSSNTTVNGYMWNFNGTEALYFWSGNAPVFLRTSLTEWMVGTNACFGNEAVVTNYYLDIVPADHAGGHPHYDVGAFVFGGLKADGTIDTTGFDALNLPETSHDLSAFTTPLHPVAEPEATEPETTEPEATEPEVTEPETNGYTASGNVVETGYAAIGAVDEDLSKAEVLLGNGKTGTVYFAGTAPKTGVVYGYELHSNNVFVFIEKVANFGNSNQSDYNTAWYLWFTPNGWAWDSNSPADVFHAPYPIFLNYGDNQWVLTTIDKIAETNGGAAAFGYVLDAVHDMPELDAGNGLTNHHAGALVIDAVREDQYAKPAQLFGAAGDKLNLGSFTADLYTPSAKTGDASPIVAVVVAALFSVGAIGFIASKKKEF